MERVTRRKDAMNIDQQAQFDSLLPANQLDRRGFIVTALGAGFALAVQPICAQTVVRTDSDGLLAGEITVPALDRELPGYRAMPAGGSNLPTVLVIQEIFGVHEYIRDVCRRLAKAGYLAIAVDMFIRHGDTTKMSNVQEIMSGPVAAASDAEHMSDLEAGAVWAAKNGGDPARRAVTGFCCGPQSPTEGRYRVVRPSRRGAEQAAAHASDRPCAANQGAGIGLVCRQGSGHRRRPGRRHAGRAVQGRQQVADTRVSGGSPWLPRRLPTHLPKGGSRRRLAASAGVVAAERNVSGVPPK